MDLLIRNSIRLIFIVALVCLFSSCVHDNQLNSLNKKNITEKNTSYDLIVTFAKNKTTLDNKQINTLISFISTIKLHNSVAIRVWIAPSHDTKKGSLNLSWLRLKKLYEIISPFIDDIELFYDAKLNKDTALFSVSWEK